MIKKLSALEFISITTDLWTSKYQKKAMEALQHTVFVVFMKLASHIQLKIWKYLSKKCSEIFQFMKKYYFML